MLPIKILMTLFASTSSAFTLTAKPADGSYIAYIDNAGNEVHERLPGHGEVVTSSTFQRPANPYPFTPVQTSSSRILGRQNGNPPNTHRDWCGCGYNLNHGDCDAAVGDLKYQLDRSSGVDPWINFYSIRGGVVAFACNPSQFRCPARGDDVARELARVTDRCGWYVAGTTQTEVHRVFYPTPLYGYMQYFNGLDFCRDATRSNQNHC